jgi:hypothetical protein
MLPMRVLMTDHPEQLVESYLSLALMAGTMTETVVGIPVDKPPTLISRGFSHRAWCSSDRNFSPRQRSTPFSN